MEPRTDDPSASGRQDAPPARLQIAAGETPLDGYVVHGLREGPGVDVACDPRAFPREHHGRYDEVHAGNVLEGFSRFEVLRVLEEWVRLLRPGGVLKVIVPDAREIARQLVAGHIDVAWFGYLLFGSREGEHGVHRCAFDAEHLVQLLRQAGCEVVKVVPSRTWEDRRLDRYCPMVTVWARRPDDDRRSQA